jgi:type I restriction enzyme, S subunit
MIFNHFRIEDICDFIGGSQPAKSEFIYEPREGYVRLIQTRDYKTDAFPTYIPENSTRKFCDEDDVMIGRYGPPIFQICRGLKGAYNVALLKAKPKKGVDREFLYYCLKQDAVFKYVDKLSARTGGQTGVDLVSLNKYPVRVPSGIDEQKKLISSLVVIDKKIELNNRINAELEALAKTLYDYWFVQFDFPNTNGKPYKTSGGKMIYSPTLKRQIPEEWEATTVGKISKTELGGTPSTSVDVYWQNADIPWLSSAETASFPIITSEQKITQAGIDNSAATLLPKGTVVISIVRYIRPSILGIDAATNQSVVGIRECKRLKSSFLYPYFCSEVPRLMGLRTGAQQPHINKGVIEDSPIVIPSDKVLTDYYKAVDPIFEKIMYLALQSHELIQLRDWLLPMLMNGQVTLK